MDLESFLTVYHLKKSPEDVIQKLEAADQNDLYRVTLAVQNDLHSGEYLRYLSGRSEWQSAKSVLDLGCGPGDFVGALNGHFPQKSYTGVDINENFIAQAQRLTQGLENCLFYAADLYDFSRGQYDFIILKAVLQHLKTPDRLMKRLPSLLTGKAAVLFIDTTKENFVEADPPIRTFNEFYGRMESLQKEHTGSRDCIAELERQLPRYDFISVDSLAPAIPVTGAENRVKAVQYLILGCAISKKLMSAAIDWKALFRDLLSWHEAENSRFALKSRLLLIAKRQA